MRPSCCCFWAALLLSVGVCAAQGQTQWPSDCVALVPCFDYVQGNVSTPSASCCAGLAGVVQSRPTCLCTLANGSALPIQIQVDPIRAMGLPTVCNVSSPTIVCGSGTTAIPAPVSPPSSSSSSSGVCNVSSPSIVCGSGTTPIPAPPSSSSSSSAVAIAVTVASVLVVAGLLAYSCMWTRRNRRRRRNAQTTSMIPSSHSAEEMMPPSVHSMGPRNFSLEELRAATHNFSDSQILGRGGFGFVYLGILSDQDGSRVAVKRISDNSTQGIKEFRAELTTIGNLRHRNLVKLKGWCYDGGTCMLVYEYMANGSLDNLLFDKVLCVKLTWTRRWSIALGLGSALQYLHTECDNVIIHRDVKASNVLLDDYFCVKLGDFGLSRQMDLGMTSHTTILAGTRGYMGPELFMGFGKATCESDVFAFGAVLLEIVTGKVALDASLLTSHEGMLLHWVWDMFDQGKLLDVVDKRLDESSVDLHEAKRLLIVALACSHPEPKARPSIRHCMEALNGAAGLPWVPPSRPVPSYGPLPSMNQTSRLLEECDTELQSSAGKDFSGFSSAPATS